MTSHPTLTNKWGLVTRDVTGIRWTATAWLRTKKAAYEYAKSLGLLNYAVARLEKLTP